MKRLSIIFTLALMIHFAATNDALAQRGRGGGARGGGFITAGRAAAVTHAPPHINNSLPGARSSGFTSRGGNYQTGQGGGSHTTQGGATIEYGGRGVGGTTAGGVNYGRGVGGVKVTTAGGQEFAKVGRAGGAVGPGGNAVGRSGSISATTGPMGSGAAMSRGGFAAGPNGMAAYRGGVAVGPNGVVAGRTGIASNGHGTYYHSAAAISVQGVYVRAGCSGYHGCFTNNWYAQYPSAWYPHPWAAAAAWTAVAWSSVAASGGYPAEEPVSYDYGSSVVYEGNNVYVNGDAVGTTADYAEAATDIATSGKEANASPDADDWQPLGVFAMVSGEEKSSNNIFQLAINSASVIRGNYYNAVTDTTEPVYGSVDKKTQRVAWTVGDTEKPVYEAGLVNLTKDETTMMVHFANDRSQQATLYRIKQDDDGTK